MPLVGNHEAVEDITAAAALVGEGVGMKGAGTGERDRVGTGEGTKVEEEGREAAAAAAEESRPIAGRGFATAEGERIFLARARADEDGCRDAEDGRSLVLLVLRVDDEI